ncbi:hypothetical protein OFL38_21395, partial [Pseudomonas aeruginosa]|nr:hypothetical protein [Pseudomonas aeruginosa]
VGGLLGNQIGGGTGKKIATVAGAVGGGGRPPPRGGGARDYHGRGRAEGGAATGFPRGATRGGFTPPT